MLLTGEPGVGKTRLAEELAARAGIESLKVDLAPVDDTALVGPTIASRLGLATGEPLDVLVNGKLLARAEVVMVDDHFGVRITAIVDAKHREAALKGGG